MRAQCLEQRVKLKKKGRAIGGNDYNIICKIIVHFLSSSSNNGANAIECIALNTLRSRITGTKMKIQRDMFVFKIIMRFGVTSARILREKKTRIDKWIFVWARR